MPCDSKISSLCHLIYEFLGPYSEFDLTSLTKAKENNLLIALSKVLRKIQLWTLQLDCDSDGGTPRDLSACDKVCSGGSNLHHEDHDCLTKILADLIVLLTVESQYIQHLVGNILTVSSEFLAVSGREWNSFNQSLCICLRFAITNVLQHPLAPTANGSDDINGTLSSFFVLKPRIKNANWYTAAGIIQVLRNTLKFLKQESNSQLLEVYLRCVSSFISIMPWDLMDDIHLTQSSLTWGSDTHISQYEEAFCVGNFSEKEPKVLFMGIFVQFFCALVEQIGAVEGKFGFYDQHSVLYIIINVVPKLLCWCLGKKGICAKMPIIQYFRHKLLILMLRLSYATHLDHFTLVSWLQLLHDYFEELLQKPITKFEFGNDECLEGSPFLLHLPDGELHDKHFLHLQRQAVFLFLRCCFILIGLTGETSNEDEHATRNSCLTVDSVSDLACYRKKGGLDLYKWLQCQFPIEAFVDHEMYSEKFINFASSFLQLYIHEDDMLFKVLLQLLSIPFCSEQRFCGEKWTFQDLKEDIFFHVSNIFNPVYLFHLFLAELHYDHQVLLDYLISNDAGISCAEYLLRSLRNVFDSWHLFRKFSMDGKFLDDTFCKKRKVLLNGYNFQEKQLPVPLKGISPSLEEQHGRDFEQGCDQYQINKKPFNEAKDCLLSLKESIENLHQKNLFPYNPKVLLKRLTNFEELCLNQR